ncbi:hypothetical protein LJC64_03045 [Ruminococcaceae bacterium OttesenSCG-928-A11]|nr:hypothetical protein [Ruminococcaceae bacterium OttesenSCG-928-A11]
MESYLSAHSQQVGRAGVGHINDYTGNLTFIHDDVSTVGGRMTAAVQHIYNTNDTNNLKLLDPYTKAGNNWRLNYQQTLSIPVHQCAGVCLQRCRRQQVHHQLHQLAGHHLPLQWPR